MIEKLIESVVPLIHKMARDFENKGLVGSNRAIDGQDLVQVGMMTVWLAVEKFDAERGVKFSTYVYPAIYRAMAEEVRKMSGSMSIPQAFMQYVVSAVAEATNNWAQKYGVIPTLEELQDNVKLLQKIRGSSTYKNISTERLDDHIKSAVDYLAGTTVSFDFFEDDEELTDMLPDKSLESNPEYMTEQAFFADTVVEALEYLPKREQEILELRFGIADGYEWTLREVGEHLGISQERVRQLEHKALQTIRRLPVRYELDDYL